ncbi:cation diffusion facilitator CzcD-associated flavoprotein CzcO [Herbihabitans rhizosphaerae]|uniref:Cation diffusion facilitator CzcD-associated flavoprotein CzcO n=1 Tax=Herbihabitans rhizosphaerae TaxID=1872711 RepID=A0A4Q7KVW1_9PSEU|nr:NAD(P)/FAD-dependent oxidoreductase [Herbihabitans rhizosphaerae]RZS40805.1 cation diffusion facilitator CzcD-associated flavoprotein CzcO [Herbihabitans rhizosphaerae]
MSTQFDAVVIGAGFGGMGAAIQLRRLGYDNLLIVDRESDLGGTWHVNRYPGLAVDIPSATYSYSFEPNPNWSRLFAPGAELKRYATHVADKYDLRRHMRFDTAVTGAVWNEERAHWAVSFDGGDQVTAKYLLAATGFLSQPKTPDIEGIDSFAGKIIHTTAWDDDYDLTGKRAAVIGTGATGVQLIPEVAKKVSELTVYQRTPIWVSPKVDFTVPKAVRRLYAALPFTQRIARLAGTAFLELLMVTGVLHYRQMPLANKLGERLCRRHLARQVPDRELRRKLLPDYSFGCKRPTVSNEYYPTFTKDHVHLETTSISHVDAKGIVTEDGDRRDIDVLLLATGFDLWQVNFPAIEIIGRDGRDLGKWWRDNRFQAYEGITVPRFPNLLSLNSPYSYSGLSYFTTIESQMKHMDRLFTSMKRRGADVFEVTERANDEFLARMTEKVGDSIFALGECGTARSYYFNQHGEAVLLRPTSTVNAFREASRFPVEDYAYA